MTVSVDATNLNLINAANATTGWTSSMGSLGTATDSPREGGTNLSDQASQEQYQIYYGVTAADWSNRTIFGWQKAADPASEADAAGAGFAMYIGDGTNNRSYDCGGSDNYAFFYSGWSSWRLNTAGLPTSFIQNGGGAPTITNISRVGYAGQRTIKANGSTDNVNIDVLRWVSNSNPALLIEGGTTGARGTFAEIVTEDENTNNAWGMIRELVGGGKAYEVMFGLQIGSLDATAYFDDADFQCFLNGSLTSGGTISAGSMDFTFVGWASGTNVINFDNFLFQSIGAVSNWDMSDTDIDTLLWSNGQFVDMGTFIFQAQDATNKTLTNLIWVNCGQVDLVGIDANNLTFNGTTDALGAIEWNGNSAPANQDNLTFNSDGTGHAIEINLNTASLTTINVSGYVFDGYAGQSGTAGNRVFYIDNALDGDVTINLTDSEALNVQGGGAGFSYETAPGYTGTVTINATVDLTINVEDEAGNPIQNAQTAIYLLDSPFTELMNEDTTAGGVATQAFNYSTPTDIKIRVRKSETTDNPRYQAFSATGQITASGFSLTVTLKEQPVPI